MQHKMARSTEHYVEILVDLMVSLVYSFNYRTLDFLNHLHRSRGLSDIVESIEQDFGSINEFVLFCARNPQLIEINKMRRSTGLIKSKAKTILLNDSAFKTVLISELKRTVKDNSTIDQETFTPLSTETTSIKEASSEKAKEDQISGFEPASVSVSQIDGPEIERVQNRNEAESNNREVLFEQMALSIRQKIKAGESIDFDRDIFSKFISPNPRTWHSQTSFLIDFSQFLVDKSILAS